jgi:hypothetical protein
MVAPHKEISLHFSRLNGVFGVLGIINGQGPYDSTQLWPFKNSKNY